MLDVHEPSTNDTLEAKRDTVRRTLNEITAELNSALVQAGFAYPVYMCVPTTGGSLLTFACPLDPADHDWERMNQIVCDIVRKRIGPTRLRSTGLTCAMAGTAMGAAEIAAG